MSSPALAIGACVPSYPFGGIGNALAIGQGPAGAPGLLASSRGPHRFCFCAKSSSVERRCTEALLPKRGTLRSAARSGPEEHSLNDSCVVARNESGPGFRPPRLGRSTTLVPTAVSDASRSSTSGDGGDAGDAQRHIYTGCCPAGGRKVASSNLAAPIRRKPASEAGFRHFGVPAASRREAPWYQL